MSIINTNTISLNAQRNLQTNSATLATTFWLALVMVCVMVVAWMARNTDLGEELPEPEWRNGPAGFGLYTYDGFRIDPHVEDD